MPSTGNLYGSTDRFVELNDGYYTGCAFLGNGLFLVAGIMKYNITNEDYEIVESHTDWIPRAVVVGTEGCDVSFLTRPVSLGIDYGNDPTFGCARLEDNRAIIAGCTDSFPGSPANDSVHNGVAIVAQLDPTTMDLALGDPTAFDRGRLYGYVSPGVEREAGLLGDYLDSSLGICALTGSLAVVGYGYAELDLLDGTDVGNGDTSGTDVMDIPGGDTTTSFYAKVCPLTIHGMEITPGTPVRVHQRSHHDDFMSLDQVLPLSADKGVFVYPAEHFRGYAVVFTVVNGEIDTWKRTLFADDPPELDGNRDLNSTEANDPASGKFGFLMGRAAVLSRDLVCTYGCNGYFSQLPLRTFRIDGLDFTEIDYKYIQDYEVWPWLVHLGDGLVFCAETDSMSLLERPDSVDASITRSTTYRGNSPITATLVSVNLTSGLIEDFEFLGRVNNGFMGVTDGVIRAYSGKHVNWDDATDMCLGDNNQIFFVNYQGLGIIDPVCWEFPQASYEQNPTVTESFTRSEWYGPYISDILGYEVVRERGAPGAEPGIQRIRTVGG